MRCPDAIHACSWLSCRNHSPNGTKHTADNPTPSRFHPRITMPRFVSSVTRVEAERLGGFEVDHQLVLHRAVPPVLPKERIARPEDCRGAGFRPALSRPARPK